MQNTAVFINVSRGQTVDEHALIRALQNGEIHGAGLDVFETEPENPHNPLL
ncbi:NAD(P)-dependent oxidoreductase [Sporosarcina sp. BP05]|uniref:NAD(P)-dependent oxidoreductase n=1 Tax=Sporosarcina sp. BP05 TaxID=2758726 RepID=UPI002106880E|nr:NAD(P)-dependent oxidoreductase [Sporosarcina sp. BP05]